MDLTHGLRIEDPPVFIPWTLRREELRGILAAHGLRDVAPGYFALHCTALEGMRVVAGFHFTPGRAGRLSGLNLSVPGGDVSGEGVAEMQRHLELAFGPPTRSRRGGSGFPTHEWERSGARVRHEVAGRFGPEERVLILRLPEPLRSRMRRHAGWVAAFTTALTGLAVVLALGLVLAVTAVRMGWSIVAAR